MTLGITATHANSTLDTMAAAYTHVKLYTGDPGATGVANASSVTTRAAITWAAASGNGSKAANGTLPTWGSWAGTNGEVVSHVGFFNASSAGTFARSASLSTPATMNTGFSLNLTAVTITLGPITA